MHTHLQADLRRSYQGNAWHGPSVLDAIDGVTAAQAAARPIPGAHSIYELTHHIAAWICETTSRLKGNTPGMPKEGDFPPNGTVVDATAWDVVRRRLQLRHDELLDALAGLDPARLDDAVDPKNRNDTTGPVSFRALVSGITQHNTYHAGQIVLLRKALS